MQCFSLFLRQRDDDNDFNLYQVWTSSSEICVCCFPLLKIWRDARLLYIILVRKENHKRLYYKIKENTGSYCYYYWYYYYYLANCTTLNTHLLFALEIMCETLDTIFYGLWIYFMWKYFFICSKWLWINSKRTNYLKGKIKYSCWFKKVRWTSIHHIA